jgi:uncharacterized protein (DUF2132 family)
MAGATLVKIIAIRCFNNDPSVKSSLKFLRKTPWARLKIENYTFLPLPRAVTLLQTLYKKSELKGFIIRLYHSSDIKPEMKNITIANFILFPFQADFSVFL